MRQLHRPRAPLRARVLLGHPPAGARHLAVLGSMVLMHGCLRARHLAVLGSMLLMHGCLRGWRLSPLLLGGRSGLVQSSPLKSILGGRGGSWCQQLDTLGSRRPRRRHYRLRHPRRRHYRRHPRCSQDEEAEPRGAWSSEQGSSKARVSCSRLPPSQQQSTQQWRRQGQEWRGQHLPPKRPYLAGASHHIWQVDRWGPRPYRGGSVEHHAAR